jgi:hypothetical protein
VANLINPVQRSVGGASSGGASSGAVSSGSGIPYTGKRPNASVTQFGQHYGTAGGPFEGGLTLFTDRRLGTRLLLQMSVDMEEFTANIGASNAAKTVALVITRNTEEFVDGITLKVPMLGLTNAGTQVGRWGGRIGTLQFMDNFITRSGSNQYAVAFTLGSVPSVTFDIVWQELRP